MSHSHESARRAAAYFDADTRGKGHSDDDFALLGTVTSDAAAVRLRDQLERRHLGRLLDLHPRMRVLDLGGGAGRIAFWLADRVAEVVLVEASAALLEAARQTAARRGVNNVTLVHSSVLDYTPEERFDLVIDFGVAAYLDDAEFRLFGALCNDALVPGGRLIVKEPVVSDGETRFDHRYDADGELVYALTFRPRDWYPEHLRPWFRLEYQRATCAHFFPWFMGGTEAVVAATSAGWKSRVLEALSPALVRFDPLLQDLEEVFRADPKLARLLAPVEVLQDLYMFRAPTPDAPSETPQLTVVMIAYNEAECIESVTVELVEALAQAGIDYEIVLVNDGSTDQTAEIMDQLAATNGRLKPVHQENQGIGGALRTGFDAARGESVTWAPADGQIGPDSIVSLFRQRDQALMLTTVYRSRDDPWYRVAISKTLNTLIRLKTGQVAKSGGNYLFARTAWTEYGPRDDDSMMISTAFRQNLTVAGHPPVEVEIDCRARQGGRSKVLNPRTISRTARQLLRMNRH
jgi:SAM-dependent methyltransferase